MTFDALTLFWVLVAYVVGKFPIEAFRRFRPVLKDDGSLLTVAEVQAIYNRKSPMVVLQQYIAVIFCLLWTVLVSTFGFPQDVRDLFSLLRGFDFLPFWLALMLCIAYLDRTFWVRSFIRKHPRFEGSQLPLSTQILSMLTVIVPLILAGIAIFPSSDSDFDLLLLGVALLGLVIGQLTILKILSKAQRPIPAESSLGMALEKVCGEFGIQPKRFLLVPGTVANAAVFKDGSIMLTTGLEELLTERQLIGIMAHELSHAKDGDAKKLSRLLGALNGIVLLILGCHIALILQGQFLPPGPDIIQLILNYMAVTPSFLLAFYTAYSRQLEFKCDRVAAEHGYGPALAEALDILHRYQMMPSVWSKALGWRLTHPSLRDRLAAIARHGAHR